MGDNRYCNKTNETKPSSHSTHNSLVHSYTLHFRLEILEQKKCQKCNFLPAITILAIASGGCYQQQRRRPALLQTAIPVKWP